MDDLMKLSDESLVQKLEDLVENERKTTSEIVETISEIGRRRLYLKLGFTSLFAYLTKGIGYTPASAQRRIDAARLIQSIPEIKEDLEAGHLNLTQISLVAQSVRQKEKISEIRVKIEDQKDLFNLIKKHDVFESQKILSQTLNLPVQTSEKQRAQADGSVRVEMTFNEEQRKLLSKVKELISHRWPTASLAEVFQVLAEDYIKRKDPTLAKIAKTPKRRQADGSTSEMEVATRHRVAIAVATKRLIFARDQCCQWINPDGSICGSRFQLQIEHRKPVWAAGPMNLRIWSSFAQFTIG